MQIKLKKQTGPEPVSESNSQAYAFQYKYHMYKYTQRKYPEGSVEELWGHRRSLPPGRWLLCVIDVSLQTEAVYVPTAVISTPIMEMCIEPAGSPPGELCVCVCEGG